MVLLWSSIVVQEKFYDIYNMPFAHELRRIENAAGSGSKKLTCCALHSTAIVVKRVSLRVRIDTACIPMLLSGLLLRRAGVTRVEPEITTRVVRLGSGVKVEGIRTRRRRSLLVKNCLRRVGRKGDLDEK